LHLKEVFSSLAWSHFLKEFSCYTNHAVRCGCGSLFQEMTLLSHVNVKEPAPF
jgi:hypothetical protein